MTTRKVMDPEDEKCVNCPKANASVLLVNHLFNTDDEHMLETSYLAPNSVLPLSIQVMREHAFDPKRIALGIPLSKVWRVAYLRARRSINRFTLASGIDLAHDQVGSEQEKMEEFEG